MGERPEFAKCDRGHIRKNMKKSAEVIVHRKGEGRNQGNRKMACKRQETKTMAAYGAISRNLHAFSVFHCSFMQILRGITLAVFVNHIT